MCDTIHLKNGVSVETVEDFEREFHEDADDWKCEAYKDINRTSCLCQLDLDRFMSNKEGRFYYDCGDWIELPENEDEEE